MVMNAFRKVSEKEGPGGPVTRPVTDLSLGQSHDLSLGQSHDQPHDQSHDLSHDPQVSEKEALAEIEVEELYPKSKKNKDKHK